MGCDNPTVGGSDKSDVAVMVDRYCGMIRDVIIQLFVPWAVIIQQWEAAISQTLR